MKKARLVKRQEIAIQAKGLQQETATPSVSPKQAFETVRSWVRQRQSERTSAYQAFAALFAEQQTKSLA